jgi:hypothetical protein
MERGGRLAEFDQLDKHDENCYQKLRKNSSLPRQDPINPKQQQLATSVESLKL